MAKLAIKFIRANHKKVYGDMLYHDIIADIGGYDTKVGEFAIVVNDNGLSFWNFYINYQYRDQKLGQEFMKFLLEFSKLLSVKQIMLLVDKKNKKAYHIYKKVGFTEVDTVLHLSTYCYKMVYIL